MDDSLDLDSPEFEDAVRAVGRKAIEETLAAGESVFYRDRTGVNVMLRPDGRRFEIRWIAGAPRGENYAIVRELTAHVA